MRKVIDIHTHLFNLKYLPVAGILVRYAHPYISHRMATAIEKLLVSHTGSTFENAQGPVSEFVSPQSDVLKANTLKSSFGTEFLKMDFYQVKKDIVAIVPGTQFLDPVVLDGLMEFQEMALAENFISEVETADLAAGEAFGAESPDGLIGRLRNLFERLIEWICTKVKQMANYFKWFRFMQNSEEDILRYLMTKDGNGVTLYIHHMMDVDNYFNYPGAPRRYSSYFDHIEQISNMASLNQKYSGSIYAFAAFDPSREDGLEIIRDAIEEKGFKGIKFYPPMGYRPFDDPDYGNRIDRLYQYCIANDVPIFAHCNKEGFEAQPATHSGHNSNPMYWYQVLKRYPTLRLCLAHAGGGEGWFAEPSATDQVHHVEITDLPPNAGEKQEDWNSSYAKIVYKLCLSFINVYCDVAYLDELSHVSKYSNIRLRLQKLFAAEPGFSKKIIYGSDWHMLFQEGINQTYMSNYMELFDEIGFTEQNREDFFWNNALNYLKLDTNL